MATENWTLVALSEIIDIRHGYAFPGEGIKDNPSPNILLTPGNFAIGGGFKGNKFKYFDGYVPNEYILSEGDLIITMTDLSKQSDTLGYPAIVPRHNSNIKFLHNQRLGKVLIHNAELIHTGFLFYLLRTSKYRHEILASATGTTVKHTSPSRILAFKTQIPTLAEQRAIAYILGSLDDKIDLNRRINETLEAMARALFKDWFVDFGPVRARMEGHQPPGLAAEIAALFPATLDAEGKPEGWRYEQLNRIVEFNPGEKLNKGEIAPYLDMAALPTQNSWPDRPIPRSFGSGMKFRNGDTLLARITPCLENGKTAFIQYLENGQVGWGSTEFIVMRPKGKVPPEYCYTLARDKAFRDHAIQSMTGTSGRQRVQAEAVARYLVVVPLDDIWNVFGETVRPWFAAIKANAEQSETLISLRDLLLPKLLSGEVRIKDTKQLLGDAL